MTRIIVIGMAVKSEKMTAIFAFGVWTTKI